MDNAQIATELAALARTVAKGQAAEIQRAELLRSAYQQDPKHWTQTRLAEAAGISQAAVSKTIGRTDEGATLHRHSDKPGYLIGRCLGVASWVEGSLFTQGVRVSWEKLLDKLIEGGTPPTAAQLDVVKRGAEADAVQLPDGQRERAQKALADIQGQIQGPLGAGRLTQQQQMWFVLGFDAQRADLLQQ